MPMMLDALTGENENMVCGLIRVLLSQLDKKSGIQRCLDLDF
jgi:hypothetical protein